jgi:hypothetical protein
MAADSVTQTSMIALATLRASARLIKLKFINRRR